MTEAGGGIGGADPPATGARDLPIGAGPGTGGGSGPERGYNARALRPALFRTRRARLATAASGAIVAALVSAPSAFAGLLAPQNEGGSPNAEHIQTLYIIAFVLGVLIFLLVEGVLIYSLIKFRWRRGGEPPAQIRGNTRLEVGWTIGAASILVVLTIVTFIFLGPIKNPAGSEPGGYVAELEQSGGGSGGGNAPAGKLQFASLNQQQPPGPANTHLNLKVNGQQFLWRYDYPGKDQVFSYVDMWVPINTTVTLDITASDVDHSWWIPDLGGKADAIPGYTNHTWFRISEPGVYEGQCAELCGEGHADMIARVHAVTPTQYKAWLIKQAADIKESQALLALTRKTRGESGQ